MVHASKALIWLAALHVGAHLLLDGCQMNLIRITYSPDTLPVAHARAYTCVQREDRRVRRQEGIVRGKGRGGGR